MKSPVEPRTHDLHVAVNHAREMLQHQAFGPALQQGQAVLQAYPDEPNALFIIGAAARGLRQLDKARDTLQQLVARTPDFALAHQELGFTLNALGQIEAAIDALQQAVALAPTFRYG